MKASTDTTGTLISWTLLWRLPSAASLSRHSAPSRLPRVQVPKPVSPIPTCVHPHHVTQQAMQAGATCGLSIAMPMSCSCAPSETCLMLGPDAGTQAPRASAARWQSPWRVWRAPRGRWPRTRSSACACGTCGCASSDDMSAVRCSRCHRSPYLGNSVRLPYNQRSHRHVATPLSEEARWSYERRDIVPER